MADSVAELKAVPPSVLEEFYFSTFYFGLEAFLLASGAGYEPSYRTTRFVAIKSKMLYHVGVVCDDCDLLALSEIHPQVADRPQSLATYVEHRFDDSRISFAGTADQWRYVFEHQGVSYARSVLEDCPQKLADEVNKDNAEDALAWMKDQGKKAAKGTISIDQIDESTVVDTAVSCATG